MDSPVEWRKACNADQPMCVEVAALGDDGVAFRDSEHSVLVYSRAEFGAFVQAIKAGEFDDLA